MSDIKLKVIPLFPSSIIPVSGVRLDKASGRWTFSVDYSGIIPFGYDVLTGADGEVLTGADGAILLGTSTSRPPPFTSYVTVVPPTPGPYLTGPDGSYLLGPDGAYLRGPGLPGYSVTPQLVVWDSVANSYFRIGSDALVRAIITNPAVLTASNADPVGKLVGTLSVQNGWGTYTFTLTSNPGGKYQIVGNQLQVAAPLTAGTDTITIHADNGAGDILNLTTTVTVRGLAGYVPTYYIYGF